MILQLPIIGEPYYDSKIYFWSIVAWNCSIVPLPTALVETYRAEVDTILTAVNVPGFKVSDNTKNLHEYKLTKEIEKELV